MLAAAVCVVGLCGQAWAGGPRFNPGWGGGWGVPPWQPVLWNTTVVTYFTDQGPLSPAVDHSEADAMVAAAAAVWTTPTSSISYAQGGTLAEDVSLQNTSFDGTQVVFPADVQVSNEGSVPVAIVYDADGGLVDLLLGQGASDPDSCQQNAVVGDIDDVHMWNGAIAHATLLLNGRCVGSAPEQMKQMQYQLARMFGRVLGLSWSQANDNVFTAQTTITANQMAYWPLMHPMDVICGDYSYQCVVEPFRLRVDDLNSLASLYPVPEGGVPPGKQGTDVDALWFHGIVYFPTGQGMDWINLTARRASNGYMEDWEMAATMTGLEYQQAIGTPVNQTAAVNSGFWGTGLDGFFNFRRIPLNGTADIYFTTQGINPLYMGDYAIGPYIRPPSALSGSPATVVDWSAQSAGDFPITGYITAGDAASSCDTGADGTESSPAPMDQSGWQQGLLCSWGHSSWWSVPVAAGHTWTMEVTATDETGAASAYKALPVMGVWNAGDASGTEPTVASAAVPLNALSLGTTQMQMAAPDSDSTYRIAVSDLYGAGRPDFTYTARLLYVAGVTPATVGSGGGQIVVTGTGFHQGNQVLVNGVPAQVVSWGATQIVAYVPTMNAAGAQVGVPVDVTVADTDTNGTATMPSALSYTVEPNLLRLVSAPAALETGITAAVPLAVRVVASDGMAPVAGETVSLEVVSGSAQLTLCGGITSCVATTDAQGIVQTTVTGGAAGSVTLQATDVSSGASVQVVLADTDPVRSVFFREPVHYVAAGSGGSWSPVLAAQQDGVLAAGVPVTWTISGELAAGNEAGATDAGGNAVATVTAATVSSGAMSTVTGCAWSQVCATWSLYGVDPSQWTLQVQAGAGQSVPQTAALGTVSLTVVDLAGHVLEGAPVRVYQRVLAWEGVCDGVARCPSAPVLATSQVTLTSDKNGAIQVAPLEVPGVPQVVQLAASTGTEGFVTLTLVKVPAP